MRTMKIAMAVVACALAAGTAQGRTVSANYTLAQDEDWTADGTVKIENSAMIDLNGHNLTVAGVSAYCITNETGVADGYSDLEYLDTSGSQRVLTNFKPADSDVVYMGVKFHEGSRATQMLWCDRSANTGNTFTGLREGGTFRFDRRNSTGMTGERHAAADNVYYDIVANYSTRECTVNGEPAATMNSTGSYTPATNLVLFASFTISNGSMTSWGNYADLRFYYLIVERAGGVVAHFVPVKRQSDGVVGVYDRVAGKFYENGNASGSPFTAGSAEITNSSSGAPAELRLDVPEGSDQYQKLEYIEATGKEYILTEYLPAGTDRVEMKVNFTSTEANQCLFCTRKTQNSRSFSLFYIKNQGGVDYEKFRFDYANKQFFGNSVTPNVDVEISIDGDTRENNIGLGEPFATALTPGPPFPFLLFGAFYEGSGTNALAKAKCYYFKVYDNAGNLKLDMVPARSLDGTMPYGMYDKVAGKFYPSSSKTAFTVHGAAKAGNYLLDNTRLLPGNPTVKLPGKVLDGDRPFGIPSCSCCVGTDPSEGILACSGGIGWVSSGDRPFVECGDRPSEGASAGAILRETISRQI